jgi:hypothetical protein
MPIQKPKSFFVNVTGSETNGRLFVGFTTHRTSPCSSGFSLRGREIGSQRSAATRAPAREKFHRGALGSRRAGERGHSEKLRNEQVQIEIENASELKKFPPKVSHAGFVFRGNVPSKRYRQSVFFQQLSQLPRVGAHKLKLLRVWFPFF